MIHTEKLMPHGVCLSADPNVMFEILIANAAHWISYSFISMVGALFLFRFVRVDRMQAWYATLLVVVFIFTCGRTHYYVIHTIYSGEYEAMANWGMFSAAVSVATLVVTCLFSEWRENVKRLPMQWPRLVPLGLAGWIAWDWLELYRQWQGYCYTYGLCG